ncbi:MAG: hypothetical protein KGM16_13225 [Bacteroidota bacterium]|nr:hypothetical protein [Bacteroidota bacterium]
MSSQFVMAYLNRRKNTALPLERIANNNLPIVYIKKRAIKKDDRPLQFCFAIR